MTAAPSRSIPHAATLRFANRRTAPAVVVSVLAVALSWSMSAPIASADDLTDRRAQVEQQIAKTQGSLNESSAALNAAGVAVDRAEGSLVRAQAELARTQQQVAAARVRDRAMAVKLKKAKAELAAAKKAVIAGQAKLDAKKALAGAMVRDQYQQQTNLLPVAILMRSSSTSDLQTRLQWSTTMFHTTQAGIDELAALQKQLLAQKAEQARLEAQVAADRKQAAQNVVTKQALEAQAESQTATVGQLLRQRQSVENAAAQHVAQDKADYVQLTKERASVEQRIAARVAKAKAERAAAARRAAAKAAQAAEVAAAARQAAAAADQRRASRAAKSSRSSAASASRPRAAAPSRPRAAAPARPRVTAPSRPSRSSSAHHGFSYPVSTGITSAYGMRFHPVLRYWKLHDGTDFGAGCGTAIRAPYAGRVVEKYYNGGYGNRLMIDHGYVDGTDVTTGFNHAIRYTVGVGERVRQGQVVGYVGSTGYSTGCHLHLMVWLDGRVSNPMSWY